jgi:hypothetical protein
MIPSQLHAASPRDLRSMTGLATRTFAAGYEIVASAFGWDLAELKSWEGASNPLTNG